MASTANFIGPFQFITLQGTPDGVAEQVLVESRPGVDGEAIFKIGKRGQPFQLLSGVDVPSLGVGASLLHEYQTLIEAGPVGLIWHDVTTAEGFGFVVLNVRPGRLRAIGTSVGGLNVAPGAWLEAIWTLLPHQYVFT